MQFDITIIFMAVLLIIAIICSRYLIPFLKEKLNNEQINALAMQREDILQYLAKLTLNYRAEAAALKGEVAQLVGVYLNRAALLRPADYAVAQHGREHIGKKSDDINPHRQKFLSSGLSAHSPFRCLSRAPPRR